jgi:glycerophosphoryl diester phosphodiesterase
VKKIAPEIETACLTSETDNFNTVRADGSGRSPWHAGLSLAEHEGSLARLVRAAGCATWSAHQAGVTGERVADAHAQGLKVLAWTVNDPAEMARLIDLGVDGIITDYPDRLRTVLAAKGKPLPPPGR